MDLTTQLTILAAEHAGDAMGFIYAPVANVYFFALLILIVIGGFLLLITDLL